MCANGLQFATDLSHSFPFVPEKHIFVSVAFESTLLSFPNFGVWKSFMSWNDFIYVFCNSCHKALGDANWKHKSKEVKQFDDKWFPLASCLQNDTAIWWLQCHKSGCLSVFVANPTWCGLGWWLSHFELAAIYWSLSSDPRFVRKVENQQRL